MPPPPPPPPPPPGGAGKPAGAPAPPAPSSSSNSSPAPAAPNALLADIQKGAKLKKTVTNDRSAPITTTKPTPGASAASSLAASASSTLSTAASTASSMGGPPQLGALFAGGMPKLKPVGSTTPKPPTSPKSEPLKSESAKPSAPSAPPKQSRPPPPPPPSRGPPPPPPARRGPPPPPPNRVPESPSRPEPPSRAPEPPNRAPEPPSRPEPPARNRYAPPTPKMDYEYEGPEKRWKFVSSASINANYTPRTWPPGARPTPQRTMQIQTYADSTIPKLEQSLQAGIQAMDFMKCQQIKECIEVLKRLSVAEGNGGDTSQFASIRAKSDALV